jgi:hypothetical protein
VVGLVEGDGRLRPPEKRGRSRLGYIDLPAHELLEAPRLVGSQSAKYHEAAVGGKKAVVLPLSVAFPRLGLLTLLLPLGAPGQVLLQQGAILVQVLDGDGMVWA